MPCIDSCLTCKVDTVKKEIKVLSCENGNGYGFNEEKEYYLVGKSEPRHATGWDHLCYNSAFYFLNKYEITKKVAMLDEKDSVSIEYEKHESGVAGKIEKEALDTYEEMLRLLILQKESLLCHDSTKKVEGLINYAKKMDTVLTIFLNR